MIEVEIPGIGIAEFPDDMQQSEIQDALRRNFPPQNTISDTDVQNALVRLKDNAGTMINPLGTSTITGGPPLSIPSGALQSTLETALEEAERPPIELPRFEERPGQTGLESGLKGLANVGAGLGEFMTSPAGLAISATGPVGHALGLGWGLAATPEVARQAGEVSVTGTPQQKVEAYGNLGLIGGGTALGATVGALKANRAYQLRNLTPAQKVMFGEIEQALKRPLGLEDIDAIAREALSQRAGEVQSPFIPEGAPPVTPTPEPMGTFRQVQGDVVKPPKPVVPETAPEPERGMTVLQEIRQKGAKTKEQIRGIFPQLSREQAAELRRLAWPEDAINQPQPKTEPTVQNITQGITQALAEGDLKAVKKLARSIPEEFTGVSESVFDLDRLNDLAPQTAEALKQVIETTKGEPNASQITSPTSVSQHEVRPRMGEEAPLRQQGETAQAQAQAQGEGRLPVRVVEETKSPPVETGATTRSESLPTEAERTLVTREVAASPPPDISQAKPGLKETQPAEPLPVQKPSTQTVEPITEEQLSNMPTQELRGKIDELKAIIKASAVNQEPITPQMRVNAGRLYVEARKRRITRQEPEIEQYLELTNDPATGLPIKPKPQPAAITPPEPPSPTQTAKAKEPWEMTFDEFKTGGVPKIRAREHRASVEQAVKEGKPVPPEVLADYPDLAPKETKGKEPWEKSRREYEAQGMSPTPDAKFIRAKKAPLDAEIENIEVAIQELNPKYVKIGSLSDVDRKILESGNISKLRKSLTVRQSTLGAAVLAGKNRPFEWATRDANPKVRELAKRRNQAIKERDDLGKQIDALADHEAWVKYAQRTGKTIPPEVQAEYTDLSGPGTPSAAQGPDPKAQIEQLTDSFKNIEGKKVPFGQKVRDAFDVGQRMSQAKDAIGKALAGLKASGDFIRQKVTGFKTVDEMLRAKGDLSAELEKRGWRVRQFVKQVEKAIPDKRQRAAIAKWVDAGGDAAVLQQGLAETKPRYKQAYQDALNLQGDALVAAENIRNYFESRLQEAIDAGVLEQGVTDYIHRLYENNPKALNHAIAYVQSGILSKNPALAKKRVFQFDWEAEKLGYEPVQDFLPRIAQYESSLSRAIAAREFIQKATTMKAPDGRPVVGVKGIGIPIEDAQGVREATLIKPDINPKAQPGTPEYRGDYINREYPALSKWKWVGKDAADKPIFLQGDIAIHPAFVGRIDALLKPSSVRYGQTPASKFLRTALNIGSTVKQTMLDLSFFHQVQIAVHATEHRVMPWNVIKEIDFENPHVDGLLRGGVTLGGEYHASHYGEGLIGRSLTRHIPGLGPIMESYHSWLFQSFIPRVKMTMALDALERNTKRYANDLKSGKMTEADLYHLTANQANAAFGELNYTMLERSKTTQDMARLILLAPDFLEARARFAGQAMTKYGSEQRVALLLGALTMYTLARIANKAIDDQYHFEPENMFSVVYNGRTYGLRTVQGDILHLLAKPVQFWMNRLNPVWGRTTLELATGRDYFGRKRSIPEQAWDAVSTILPISLRTSRERSMAESMMNAFGVTARRWNDVDDAYKLAQKWKDANGIGEKGEFIYDSNKDPLRPLKIALSFGDEAGAVKEIKTLMESGKMKRTKLNEYFNRYADMSFAGSRANDRKWMATLTEDQKKTVESAKQHKRNIRDLYRKARDQYEMAKAQALRKE